MKKALSGLHLCIASSYDDNYRAVGEIAEASIRRYAEMFGYDWRIFTERLSDRPAGWDKISTIRLLFEEGYDWVFWLDADALFVDYRRDIADEIEVGKHIYYAHQTFFLSTMPGVRMESDNPNIGVLFLQNTPITRQLMDGVWNMTQYISIPPSDNRAFNELIGYFKTDYALDGVNLMDPTYWKYVKVLSPRWNSVRNISMVYYTPNAIIHHYQAQPYDQRLLCMREDYRRTVLHTPAPRVSEVAYDFNQPYDGDGWYTPELLPNGLAFRWMGSTTAILRFPLDPAFSYEVNFQIVHTITPYTLETFRLKVNDTPIPLDCQFIELDGLCAWSFTGGIPQEAVQCEDGDVVLQFSVEELHCPQEFAETDDYRLLGVAVAALRITPQT
jgi:hypothetical protein